MNKRALVWNLLVPLITSVMFFSVMILLADMIGILIIATPMIIWMVWLCGWLKGSELNKWKESKKEVK